MTATPSKRTSGESVYIVARCPFCNGIHEHKVLGRRVAPCAMGVYVLVAGPVEVQVGDEVVGEYRGEGKLRRGVVIKAPRRKGGLAIVQLEIVDAA